MSSRDGNTAIRAMRAEVVSKPDGRYLIYYTWDDDDAADEERGIERGEPTNRGRHPEQEPWSPQAGPVDA